MALKRKARRRRKNLSFGYFIGIFLVISLLAGIAILLLPLEKENTHTVFSNTSSSLEHRLYSSTEDEKERSFLSASQDYRNENNGPKQKPRVARLDGGSSATTSAEPSERNISLVHTRPSLKQGRLAVVIDDAGYDLTRLKAFLDFPGKLTIAVLPQLRYSRESAKLIKEAGKEVLLHQPLQPLGFEDAGPGSIEVTFSREEIFEVLDRNLATVPYAVGVNNHMGSLATQDRMVMDAIFAKLKEEELFFLDSRTVATTVVQDTASKYGVSYFARNIFLDSGQDLASMQNALTEGVSLAKAKGQAVLIGHVQHQELAELLKKNYEVYQNSGVEFVFLSDLLPRP